MSRKLLNLCSAALLSVVSTAAWALSEVGGVYQIGTAEDLKAFAELVNGGEGMPYLNAVLTADINKGADETMIGRDGLDYQGCFDGAGHTITIDVINQDADGTAIFRNVGDNALIKNLKVQGTITTDKKYASGIAAWSSGTIRGCYIDVNVVSAMAGDATHGGVVGVAYQGAMIENCLAKFTINGATTQNSGGVVGWCDGRTNVINCLVISDGSNFDLTNGGSGTIGRNDGQLQTVNLAEYIGNEYDKRPGGASTNNYATNAWGNTKCVTIVPYDGLADGRICYQLNTDQSNIAWVQQIGTDDFPVPAAFGSAQVYASGPTECDGKSEGELTFSNTPSNALVTAHAYDKFGICQKCGCYNFYALERDATDGYYLIKTPEDIDMAEGWNRITNGARFSIKLANDVKYTAEEGRYIFNPSNWFDGCFNGDGHTLTIEMSEMDNNAALFPKFAGRRFENVIMHGTISTNGQYAGSVAGQTYRDRVNIINTYSDITINANHAGDNTTGGFIGICESKTQIENCIYAGDINGLETSECLAGFCGWSNGQSYWTNCAFLGNIVNGLGDSKTISRNPSNITTSNVYSLNDYGYDDGEKYILFEDGEAGVKSGELAYFLNGKAQGVERFYQLIGTDPEPMPIKKEGALVYATASSYRCDGSPEGETVYSNTPASSTIPPHQFVDGFCSVCGALQEDFLTPVDGWFEISNGAELAWWSNYAAKKDLGASARLTDDIDMDGYCDRWANVGTEGAPFYGNFDGQFHTISNLVIDHPADNGVGLIAVMNSLPTNGYGGISDADARAAEGVYIKNVVLDETCELIGRGYIGLVGMTAPWAGHVNIKGVMMCGDVRANGGPNASGVFGCVMSSTCHVTIDNCGMVGNVYGTKENGSFSGWLGSYAEVTNCFAVGSVEGIQDDDHYFARYSSATFTNCYSLYGTQVPTVSEEDFASGALAWRANGSQFRTSYWYQTIGDDMYPFPDPSHGTVIYAAEQYFSVANEEELADVAKQIQNFEVEAVEETIATQSVLDEYNELLEALPEAATILEFADAIDAVNAKKAEVAENAATYQAYIDKCEDIKKQLDADDSFGGALRESLEYYLSENDEPNDENPLGTYLYIVEEHTATAEEIAAETDRVAQWLASAIAADYVPGTDVSMLITNSDFSKQKEGWTNAFSTGYSIGSIKNDTGQMFSGVEAWNVTGDQYQAVEGLKPGYYLIGTNAAFRPSNNRYSTNYAAGIYANGIFNYFPTVIEDYVPVDEAEDGVNCNLTIKSAYDLAIYDDFTSTSEDDGAELLGYAVHGETGMAIAAMANRYQVYTIALVGEDGKLTVGIKNPGTKYSSDWTGWSALKMTYCGDAENEKVGEALTTVLDNMLARANSILEYEMSDEDAAAAPNFPGALMEELEGLVGTSKSAETVEAKAALAAKFSDVFQRIYEGKQAYIALYNAADGIGSVSMGNLPLVEKDEETGEWYESGGYVFSQEETDAFAEVSEELFGAYYDGTYSTAEALEAASLNNPVIAAAFPDQDEDGNYLIANPKQYVAFRAIAYYLDTYAKGKLVSDIDMTGIGMQPGNDKDTRFHGILDGQGYALNNVYIAHYAECTGLFGAMDAATVKNLKVTGEYYSDSKFIGGITGYTYGNCVIDNCDVAVKIYSTVDGDGTHGGLIGVNETEGTVVSNCLIDCPMFGESTNSCGGVIGWSTNASTVKNTLILSQGSTISSSSCNIVSRNPDNCTVSDVYYVEQIGDSKGTKVTAEQLASGEIAYKLNGSQSENVAWFQTLGTDATPRLFEGAVVYFYGGKYINEKPNPQLNAFAFNLDAKKIGDNVEVSFNLNAEAESVEVNFYNGEDKVYTAVSNEVFTAGVHKVVVPVSELAVEDVMALNYDVAVTGKGSLDALKMGESYKFNSPYGLAVNNNPASKGFGQVLITESRPTEDREGMFSTGTPGALFAFDAAFEPVGSYYGGLDLVNETPITISGDYQFDLKDIRFSKDGRLFVGRASGTSNSSVWEINPDDLDEPWKPVFTGGELDEATGITYVGDEEQNRMAVGLALEGAGEDLKMYVLGAQRSNGEYNTTDYNCAYYNLGTATEWSAAPSGYIAALDGVYTIAPGHVGIHEDGQGGLWYIQYRATPSAELPAIKHYDAEGNEDYSDIKTSTNSGKMAVTADGKYLAIPMGSGKVVIYETNYVPMANGRIYLDPKYNISVTETNITGLAFDYAGNLYAASSATASKSLSRYTIPTENKLVVTPGNGIGNGIRGDINGDGELSIADAQTILILIANSAEYSAAADINGDGEISIADAQSILIMIANQ